MMKISRASLIIIPFLKSVLFLALIGGLLVSAYISIQKNKAATETKGAVETKAAVEQAH